MKQLLIIFFSFTFFVVGYSQKIDTTNIYEEDFFKSEIFKEQVSYTYNFISQLKSFKKKKFLKKGEYDDNWKLRNLNIIENYSLIHYKVNNCTIIDTNISFNTSINKRLPEGIRKLSVKIVWECFDNCAKPIFYISLIFFNKISNNELISVECKFKEEKKRDSLIQEYIEKLPLPKENK